jgi:hypothetical protein
MAIALAYAGSVLLATLSTISDGILNAFTCTLGEEIKDRLWSRCAEGNEAKGGEGHRFDPHFETTGG